MWTTGKIDEANKGSFDKVTWGDIDRLESDTKSIYDLADTEWDELMSAVQGITAEATEEVPVVEEVPRRKGGLRARAPAA
jgi:hypothetical protein